LSNWDEDLKKTVIAEYLAEEPTPETSTEIVAALAEKHEFTVNSIRMMLTKAGVYIAKSSGATAKKADKGDKPAGKSTGTRVSKESAHAALTQAIEAAGKEVDEEIISKLTGKAAVYFTGLFK
jgi:hypothetical protein